MPRIPALSIASKFAVVFTMISILITGTAGFVVYRQNSRDLIRKELNLLGQDNIKIHQYLQQQVVGYIRDTLFLAAVPPISGIIRGTPTGIDSYDGTPLPLWKERLQTIFKQFLHQNPSYFQIRLIGLADNGRELVRVEKAGATIRGIPDHQLQAKGDRPYLRQTMALLPGDVFLSKINFNREHGRISTPVIRTLRVAVPIRDTQDTPFGLIIINVDMGAVLDRIQTLTASSSRIYLTDAEGNFLVHPDPEKCFGFEKGHAYTLDEELPSLQAHIGNRTGLPAGAGPRVWVDGENVFAFSALLLAREAGAFGNNTLFLLAGTPRQAVLRDVTENQRQSLFLVGGLILISALLIMFLSRHLTTPITRVTRDVMAFRSQDPGQGETDFQGDELAILRQSFQAMTGRINQITTQLEKRVAERTFELSKVNAELSTKIYELHMAAGKQRLFEKIFEQTHEAIIITDNREKIIDVNQAYLKATGFSREDLLNRSPRIGKSDRHSKAFYRDMWETIKTTGQWSGEIWDRRKSGEIYPKLLNISAVSDRQGKTTHYVGIFSDITDLKATEKKLESLAYYDPLTRLPNRVLFQILLRKQIEAAARSGSLFAVMYLDLDRFKYVNDTYGHSMGDLLLKQVAQRLSDCVRKADTVARLGGDEFVVLLRDIDKPESAAGIAGKIIDDVTRPIRIRDKEVVVGASIGISLYPSDGSDMESLMKNADMAMYQVKESGRNHYQFFEKKMNQKFTQRVSLEKALRNALEKEEFVLHYQPRVSTVTGTICGAEALIRWNRDGGRMVPPDLFIPIAEETGLINPIGEWVIKTACRQCKTWQEMCGHSFSLSVNLSMKQFLHHDLEQMIVNSLKETGLEPSGLDLEITESSAAVDMGQTVTILKRLNALGITLSIDDFGTGYSSLSYLKQFPIQNLKVDRSFVLDILTDRDAASIAQAIVALGHSLGLSVVAEGVETRRQLAFFQQIMCDECQGFFFHPPLPEAEFTKLLIP